MIALLQEALNFEFFQNALLVGSMLAVVCGFLGTFIVVRNEVMISHTIANIAFLGVVAGTFFGLTSEPLILISALIGVLIISIFQKTQLFGASSVLEFTSQLAISGAIIILSQFEGYSIDLMQFLFGDILALNSSDIYFSSILTSVIILVFIFLRKPLLQVIFNQDLAKANGVNVYLINAIYLFLVAAAIAIGIKIIGIILLAAFLVIPPNIAKLVASSFHKTIVYSVLFALIGTVAGLFLSYFFNTPSGAMIVLSLGTLLVIATAVSSIRKK